LLYEKIEDKKYDFYHTEVPEEYRGKGFGAQLAEAAFNFIIKEQATVVLSCSYLRKFANDRLNPLELEKYVVES